MRWVIEYRGGGSFSNVDGSPEAAPGAGVIGIGQEDGSVGFLVHQGENFYCFDEQYGGWCGMDVFGLAQYLSEPGFKVVKLGTAMPTADFRAVLQRLRSDPRLPKKSAHYPWERT